MKFYEKEHTYIHQNQKYLSCTNLIKNMFPKFQKSKIATKYAKKHNLRKKDVLKDWKQKGTQASRIGTIIHNIAENKLNNISKKQEFLPEDKKKIKSLIKNLNNITLPEGTIYTEQILFDTKTLVSGTVDLIITTNKYIHIMDWKTSKEISKFGFRETDNIGYNIPNANYYKYSLQLAVYQYLLNTTPNLNQMIKNQKYTHSIIHIPSETIIYIPDKEMKQNNKTIKQMINYRKKDLKALLKK